MKTAEEIIQEKGTGMICVSPDTTIHDALKIMVDKGIGAMLVQDESGIVGIWTERDLMKNTLQEGFDPKTARIGDYMTRDLVSAKHDDSMYKLLDVFLGRRLRHLLIEKDGTYIGMLSSGDVIKANLVEKTKELEDMNELMSWEFYENWRWTNKK
ncbi:MAG TPA: CBS domain-containing protein [Bacteroidetes bacterium]|nr:CBS domain-containing protein [Bacteroidota bacterium]